MFWEKFIFLCEKKKESPNMVCSKLGFSTATATKWKNGSVPRDTTLLKIADYFAVSLDYLLGKEETAQQSEVIDLDQRKMRMVPLFETVSAGFGAYASDSIEDYMPLYFSNPSEALQTICIKVRGDSMYPKIENGDIIQVHKQESVDSGSIAVVLLDGDEGLVKVVEYGSDWIELRSINPMYPPMRFERAETAKIRVVGLVTQVIKGINGRKPNSIKISDNKKELLDNIDKMDADQLREFNRIYNEYLKKKEN